MLAAAENMPEVTLAPGMTLACYDQLMDAADDDYVWPTFDENTASALCYTSGTTGRPKGVLYSHRSTWLHAYSTALPDVLCIKASSRVLPVVPMFHVNAWGMPYAAALTGASLVLPGRHLDGASMANHSQLRKGYLHCRRAHGLAWFAAISADQRGTPGNREAHHDRWVRRAAAADRGVPR